MDDGDVARWLVWQGETLDTALALYLLTQRSFNVLPAQRDDRMVIRVPRPRRESS